MHLEDLETTFDTYITEALRLKAKYAGQIEILIGLESEYIIQSSLDKLRVLLEQYSASISYIVGSVHHVNSIPIDFDKETFDRAVASFSQEKESLPQLQQLFCAYFDAQYRLLYTFRPEVIGHFDLCRLYLPDMSFCDEIVWKRVERNVRFAVEYGALFEVNAAAFRKGWRTAYPGADVLKVGLANLHPFLLELRRSRIKLIVSLGGRLTISDDSHGPDRVGLHYSNTHVYLSHQNVQDLWCLMTMESSEEAMVCNGNGDGTVVSGQQEERPALVLRTGLRTRTKAVKLHESWKADAFWEGRKDG